ncbi:6-phosphofructokinase 2 [Rhodovulum iodosum]|uniref:Phosphofructokinase n=1 Tax=Rhodovulum iodosum TaxID=68291 RepID=A0ABV3XVL4_9RHOB|nr:1-phosphofructokinase family hexose kinase [Rhodovulum robiginosum]RSK32258.1 1-phosphofructokinase family hexose kinase [Rhodovulum robiginosum]
MQDILTVTLNPAVDISTSVAKVEAGPKLRCAPPVTDPGGGGINVSRAIRLLGGQSRALVAIGGHNGRKLRSLLEAEGIRLIPITAPGETRQSLAVSEDGTGAQYRFVMPGPIWNTAGLKAILAAITTAMTDEGLVVISGSVPPGLPTDYPKQVCACFARRPVRVVIDTSGPALELLAGDPGAPPEVLRMDAQESVELAGRPLPTPRDSADFAAEMVRRGVARTVVVARGAEGSVLATEERRLFVEAAKVPVRSKVGAGDSFVGGFSLALARGEDLAEALRWGAAAASAAVMTDATALCTREDTEGLLPRCPVHTLD